MQTPEQKTIPFARDGQKSQIPVDGTSSDERASYQMGFPPRTMIDGASAVPPSGEDVNGILNDLSSISIFQQAGGLYPFNGAFAQGIGGYPIGAIVRKSDGSGFWFNSVANNMTNPDNGGAGWIDGLGEYLPISGGTMAGLITFASNQTFPSDTSKADIDFSNVTKPYVVEIGENSAGKWVIYSNGWVEQCGKAVVTNASDVGTTVQLPIEMNSSSYEIFMQMRVSSNGYTASAYALKIAEERTSQTSFNFICSYATANGGGYGTVGSRTFWKVGGWKK